MEILAATNNEWKLEELRRILGKYDCQVKGLAEAGFRSSPNETGETFAENAFIKAAEACRLGNCVALADDSGICVDALGGSPGVMSARFAGNGASDADNNRKLMKLLSTVPYARRGATFMCAIVVVAPDGAELRVEGECKGVIGLVPSGTNGFGYDPLFFVDGKSFADLQDDEKDKVSHRGKALRALAEQLPAFLQAHGDGDYQAPAQPVAESAPEPAEAAEELPAEAPEEPQPETPPEE